MNAKTSEKKPIIIKTNPKIIARVPVIVLLIVFTILYQK